MDLFAALEATWPPAETVRLGPWRLRRGEGGGSRVSAATLEGPLGEVAAAEAAMRGFGQRPLFMVREGERELDRALEARGYAVKSPSLLMAAPVAGVAHSVADVTTIDCTAPLVAMEELWAEGGIGPARLAVMARAPQPKTYFLGRLDERPAGVAFVGAAGPVAMVHALHVSPRFRLRGLGARLSRAAAAWGATQGVETFGLAVEESNAAARMLYTALGLRVAGRYHYRIAPEEAER
jgi:ribosomal protein S18 acetylase RimI-like enzyme